MKSFTASCYGGFIELLCSSTSVVVQQDLVGQVNSRMGMRDFCHFSQIFSWLLGAHVPNRKECDGKKWLFGSQVII